MKKINVSFFLALFILTLIYSCSTESVEETYTIDNTKLQIEELVSDNQSIQNPPLNNTSSAKSDDGGGGWVICYNAHMKYDTDCDGEYESAVDILTSSMTCCIQKVAQLTAAAKLIEGLCYGYADTGEFCKTMNCGQVPICNDDF